LQAFIGIVGQPFIMGVCAAGKTEMDGRVGFMVGNIVKRLCTMAWCITALGAIAWYIQQGIPLSEVTADHVYGDMARSFLPAMMPGLMGVFIASLLASAMSSCSAFMISSSGLFTKNIYKPFIIGKQERHYLLVGRITSFLVVIGGLAFAYWVPDVITALNTWFKIQPMVGLVFWMGLLWRWATPAGAWATTLVGFGTWWLTTLRPVIDWVDSLPIADSLNMIIHSANKPSAFSEPWVILLYTLAALGAGVVVSLLTKPVDRTKLDTFYALTRTPIVEGEVLAAPCTLPVGVMPAERRMITTAFGLEIPMPSATSWWGFLAGWIAIAALVIGFYQIVR
jgi:Na+/proline symporter